MITYKRPNHQPHRILKNKINDLYWFIIEHIKMGQSCTGSEGPLNQDEAIFLDSDPNKNSYKGQVDELGRPNGKGVFFYSKDGSKF